jgi:hypothetical protein
MLQPGQIVKIYEVPLTNEILEGEALLLKQCLVLEDLEFWKVQFTESKLKAFRAINRHRRPPHKKIFRWK